MLAQYTRTTPFLTGFDPSHPSLLFGVLLRDVTVFVFPRWCISTQSQPPAFRVRETTRTKPTARRRGGIGVSVLHIPAIPVLSTRQTETTHVQQVRSQQKKKVRPLANQHFGFSGHSDRNCLVPASQLGSPTSPPLNLAADLSAYPPYRYCYYLYSVPISPATHRRPPPPPPSTTEPSRYGRFPGCSAGRQTGSRNPSKAQCFRLL